MFFMKYKYETPFSQIVIQNLAHIFARKILILKVCCIQEFPKKYVLIGYLEICICMPRNFVLSISKPLQTQQEIVKSNCFQTSYFVVFVVVNSLGCHIGVSLKTSNHRTKFFLRMEDVHVLHMKLIPIFNHLQLPHISFNNCQIVRSSFIASFFFPANFAPVLLYNDNA